MRVGLVPVVTLDQVPRTSLAQYLTHILSLSLDSFSGFALLHCGVGRSVARDESRGAGDTHSRGNPGTRLFAKMSCTRFIDLVLSDDCLARRPALVQSATLQRKRRGVGAMHVGSSSIYDTGEGALRPNEPRHVNPVLGNQSHAYGARGRDGTCRSGSQRGRGL